MMRKSVIIVMLLFSVIGFAQNNIMEIQNTIDEQVWKPFQKAFETLDGKALNATYAKEVLRATPNGIDTDNTFKTANLKRFQKNKKDGIAIALDFWFDSRRTNENTSYEVGFYRIGFTNANAETSYSYGQFHIVLKKINGAWKITQDWDTATINEKAIGADDFAKQVPLKF
jgi:ketosteroid isomerase-like protein